MIQYIGIVHAHIQCQIFASNDSSKVIYLFSGININNLLFLM